MLRASPSLTDVTTFQAARPFVIRSSVAKRRATSNGSKYVVEHVEARPSLVVTAAIVISTIRGTMIVAVAVGHGQAIVEERHMKPAGFEDAGDLLVVVRRVGVIARLRMSPGAWQVRAVLRLQEADHHHLPRHGLPPERRDPWLATISAQARRPSRIRRQARTACSTWHLPHRCRTCAVPARTCTRPRLDKARRNCRPRVASL